MKLMALTAAPIGRLPRLASHCRAARADRGRAGGGTLGHGAVAAALAAIALRGGAGAVGRGAARARSHCRVAPPLIHFIPDSLTYSVPLSLKRQSDRTLGAATHRPRRRLRGGPRADGWRLGRPRA
jgi:hypothetical protein